jgi:glycosyltransferase involved in cell wall biosynthesis
VTTDVPGCRTLVRDGIEGRIVAPNDAFGLAAALVELSRDLGPVARMGEAARERVLDGFTERDVMAAVQDLYRRVVAA